MSNSESDESSKQIETELSQSEQSEQSEQSDLEVIEQNNLKRQKQKHNSSKRQKKNSLEPIVVISDSNTDSQFKTSSNSKKLKKHNKKSTKINLNKISNQLIPTNTKPGTSWIWDYFKHYKSHGQYKKIGECLVQQNNKKGHCGHFIGSDGSTGNFISHLAKHRITEESHKRKMHEFKNNNQSSQPSIEEILRSNPDIKQSRDKKFVGMLIKDIQPISMCNDEGFIEFIHELDPYYQLPSKKTIQQLLAESYNQIKTILVKKFNEEIISCSLTTDLWTARSKNGYIGVTCSFIDNDFKLCEAILAIQYIPYPHTGYNICNVLTEIISDWNLTRKVFTLTTDNGSNMVKAGTLMTELTRLPCSAHTLQLVIGKGLLPAEVLIARAKRLINFFTTPKQTEKLIEIQKNNNHINNEVIIK